MHIDRFFLFSQLNAQQRARIESRIRKKHYPKGSILFFQGDPSESLYMLAEGVVKAYKSDASGKEVILHYFRAPTLIAEMATFEGIPFPATISTESDAEIWSLERKSFMELLYEDPAFSLALVRSLSTKIKILETMIERNMTMDAMQRIVTTLLESPELFEQLPRTKIAAILNMSPETLSRLLRKLKERELIRTEEKRIILLEPQELERYRDHPAK